mgnify:CR=1 FL=1
MATSYRKLQPDIDKILVFERPPLPQPRPAPEKLPSFHKPTELHDVHALLDRLRKLPKLRSEKWEVGETYTLSARKPWVEDRGYIDAFQPIMAIPEQPTFQFANHIGVSDEGRHIEIWLTRLTPGASYIVQLRLQAGTGGTYHISTGEGTHQTSAGGDQTVAVLLYQVEREMSLVRIENHGASYWAFVDATITAIAT